MVLEEPHFVVFTPSYYHPKGMASRSQTQGGLAASSVSSPQATKNIVAHNLADGRVPFSYMPLPVSPSPAVDCYGNQQNLSRNSVYDLDMPFDMNCALDQDFLFANNLLGTGFDGSVGPGCEAPTSLMNSYHVENSFPRLGSINSSDDALRRPNSSIIPGAYDNQVRVNAPQINDVNRLDGRFLSLGTQNNSAFNTNSTAYRRVPSHMCENPFPPCVQEGNDFHDSMGERLTSLRNNIHELRTPLDFSEKLTLAESDHNDLQATTSAFGVPSVPMFSGGQVNIQRLMPELKEESDSRISLSGASERQMQRVPFNPSVLRSNRQNAADPLKKVYVRTNKVSPRPLEIGGGVFKQEMSAKISPPNAASYVGMGERCKMFNNTGPQSANQGVKNQRSYSSTAVVREPLKRSLDSPEQSMMQYQRRKIMAQSSSLPLSSRLLQNAPGRVSANQSMPFCSTSTSSLSVNPTLQGSLSSDTNMNLTALPATSWAGPGGPTNPRMRTEQPPASRTGGRMQNPMSASIPSTRMHPSISPVPAALPRNVTHQAGGPMLTPTPAFTSPTMHPSIPHIPAALPRNIARQARVPMLTSMPAYTPTLFHPSISPPVALPRNVARRAGGSIRVVTGGFPPLSNNPSPVAIPRMMTPLSHANTNLITPDVATLRKSPHALTTAENPFSPHAAWQSPATMPHIKWQGFDTPTPGFKCMLCKRDLCYAPDGPVSIPAIPQHVAVLPCGHTFHDCCLQRITPDDQSKDPPCIPCAIGDN